jgi:ubiquitin C-terminal hydrolase
MLTTLENNIIGSSEDKGSSLSSSYKSSYTSSALSSSIGGNNYSIYGNKSSAISSKDYDSGTSGLSMKKAYSSSDSIPGIVGLRNIGNTCFM